MKRRPQEMGTPEVERYLSELATKGKVAASTQRQALNAIIFLYREAPLPEGGRLFFLCQPDGVAPAFGFACADGDFFYFKTGAAQAF